jgi:hypothetical protein
MEMIKEKTRKVRSDKKKDVKPTLPVDLKECIYRIAYITGTPVKDLSVVLCEKGFLDYDVMNYLSEGFRRTVRLKSTLYMGDLSRPSLRSRLLPGQTGKITIRFDQLSYENLCTLSYALDVTPSRATALLLTATIHHSNIVNNYVIELIKGQVDELRMKELRKVLNYLNANNSNEAEVTWISFLSHLYDEVKNGETTISDSVHEFLKRWRNM